MIDVGVLFGGRSGEHEVSLCSAASVISAMDRNKYRITAIGIDTEGRWHVQEQPEIIEHKDFGRIMKLNKTGNWTLNHFERGRRLVLSERERGIEAAVDVVFPALHGTYCEDGTLQGLLELAMVPFVGADAEGSAIGMDKDVAKRLLRDRGIPVVPWKTLSSFEWKQTGESLPLAAAEEFGWPLFVKPARTGSSVGVVKAANEDELFKAIRFAFRYDTKLLIEKAVDAREIECAVLGNDDPAVSVPGEVSSRHEFYSYEAKYIDPEGAELIVPAPLDENVTAEVQKLAKEGYQALNCSGMARVDFFLSRETGTFFLNEINTLPGFTSISMYPQLWEYSGIGYVELIDRLIELAFERHTEKMRIVTEVNDE